MKGQLRWSKNTTEEKCCHSQMLLPSNEPLLYPILNLSIYLETYGNEAMGSDDFYFGGDSQRSATLRTFESLLFSDKFNKSEVLQL